MTLTDEILRRLYPDASAPSEKVAAYVQGLVVTTSLSPWIRVITETATFSGTTTPTSWWMCKLDPTTNTYTYYV